MIRVVKLGGSLLALPDLATRFDRWLRAQPPAVSVLLIGGGAAVEGLRAQHGLGQLTDEQAHWAAVAAMRDHAQSWLASGAIRGTWLARWDELGSAQAGLYALDPVAFLREVDPRLPGGSLPCSWEVTSDSIAARVAVAVSAAELVLLKSTSPPPDCALDDWARGGFVDPYFPTAARGQTIRCVDLRTEPQAAE